MEEMKIRFCLILPLLFIICLSSCASTPAVEGGKSTVAQDVHKEKKQNSKKLLFEDWKYKGFGQPLPVWFEAAYKGDENSVKAKLADIAGLEIKIITGQGINSDQADKSVMLKSEELTDYTLYEMCWVLLGEKADVEGKNEDPYFAAAVYYK